MKTAARQLIRAIRGSEPQAAFSSRLGYRSNVAAEWEGGRRFPHALELFRICAASDIDAPEALRSLVPRHAPLVAVDTLGPWFDAVREGRSQLELARSTGRSRHQIRRWLTGTAVPRIPDLLVLLDALTGRPASFAAALVGDRGVPALHPQLIREREAVRARRRAHVDRLETDVHTALARVGIDNVTVHALAVDPEGFEQLRTVARATTDTIPSPADSTMVGIWVVGATSSKVHESSDE